jgi:hypothetical protein
MIRLLKAVLFDSEKKPSVQVRDQMGSCWGQKTENLFLNVV